MTICMPLSQGGGGRGVGVKGEGIEFFPCLYVPHFVFANHFKFIHKVRNLNRKVKFNFVLYHFLRMPLFILAESGGIHILWTHSYIIIVSCSQFVYESDVKHSSK